MMEEIVDDKAHIVPVIHEVGFLEGDEEQRVSIERHGKSKTSRTARNIQSAVQNALDVSLKASSIEHAG